MFIRNETDTLFEVIAKYDNACDPEQRWKEMRWGVWEYNERNGTKHEFTADLLKLYWVFCKACQS